MDVFGVFIQMTFTDDDLKRLKVSLSGELPEFSTWAKSDLEVLRALLARLEAAEALVQCGGMFHNSGYDGRHECKAYEAWRRACGK